MKNIFEDEQSAELIKGLSGQEYELNELHDAIIALKERFDDPCDPSLRFKKKQSEPESLEDILKRVQKKVDSGVSEPVEEDDVLQTPEYRNKFRTRWFSVVFANLEIVIDGFSYKELHEVLDLVLSDFRKHVLSYSGLQEKFKNGKDVIYDVKYESYLIERKGLIDRLDKLIISVGKRVSDSLK